VANLITSHDKLISRLKTNRRQSIQALPVFSAMLIGAICLFWFLPGWGTGVVLAFATFSWIGDAINIFSINRKLKKHEQDPL
jgi:hypothetical protein